MTIRDLVDKYKSKNKKNYITDEQICLIINHFGYDNAAYCAEVFKEIMDKVDYTPGSNPNILGIEVMESLVDSIESDIEINIDEVIEFKNIVFPDEVYNRAGIKKGSPLYCTFNNLCNGSYEEGIETKKGLLDDKDVAFCLFKTPEENDWYYNPENVVVIGIEENDLQKDIIYAITSYFYDYLNDEEGWHEAQEEYDADQENKKSLNRSFVDNDYPRKYIPSSEWYDEY